MYTYAAKIVEIYDGDTVTVDIDLGFNIIVANQKIRLSGIDTPEIRTIKKDDKEFGLLSRKKLSEQLPIGSWQKIQTIKSSNNDDKFGRILGIFIMENGQSLNQWMIDNNYAVNYNGENKLLIQEQHQINRKKLIERGELKNVL